MAKLSNEVIAAGLLELTKLRNGEMPTERELEGAPILSSWVLDDVGNKFWRLGGFVTGHPTIEPGWCWTSVVLFIAADQTWARTVSRYYRLGEALTDQLNR